MNPPSPHLAALVVDLPKQNRGWGKVPSLLLGDMLVIVGVGLALLVVLASGIYIAKRLKRRRRHVSDGEKVYRGASDSAEPDTDDDAAEDEDDNDQHHHGHHHSRRRYKYRARRRTHRSRNPTLSETGGLPPVKDPESKAC